MSQMIDLVTQYGAHNYDPLPVVLVKGQGACVFDEKGKPYIDMMSAYSAVSHGHCHPALIRVLTEQANRLSVVSRAYHADTLGLFLKTACELFNYEKALPMNTGAEAVETAIKMARKWAYTVKKVAENKAEIISCSGNFHGRTVSIISFSTEPAYRAHFGPFTPGFVTIPYGDASALASAINENTAAFLVEPIQGEAGIIVPPEGYLRECERLCRKHNVLLMCDEIQTGLGRTGKLIASEHEAVRPDCLILGKALGGGLIPVSMVLADASVMSVFKPGDHGSTFGGYGLAAAVGKAALDVLVEENLVARAEKLGQFFMNGLKQLKSKAIKEIRGKGLMLGIEVDPRYACARDICLALLERGVLSKETHEVTIRLAPPLVISEAQLTEVLSHLKAVFSQ
ncbi:MAG: rocD [Gammaproteobacteria bacterium]|nr:rocD [Gammaproteobacteria bacterium]